MNSTTGHLAIIWNTFMNHSKNGSSAGRWLFMACAGLALCACDTPPAPAAVAPARTIAAVRTTPAPAATAMASVEEAPVAAGTTEVVDDGEAAADSASACSLETPAFSSPQGSFGMVPCEPSEDDPLAPVEFHFVHRGANGDTVGVQYVDRDTWSATVDETEPKFWDGHIMTLDLPQERGGVLLIANWTGERFANSAYHYMSGDEDGLQLAWRDGAFLVTTSTDGQRRLLPDSTDPTGPGAFAQESLSCSDASSDGLRQDVSLAVDIGGQVSGVSYLASTPAGDGTANSCSVDASRDDGDTDWGTSGRGAQLVAWRDGEVHEDGGVVEPSRLSITRNGDLYTLDLRVQHSSFCGQSSALATRIVLRRGQKHCAKVEF